MVKEDAVALFHLPHGVSREVVADAVPVVGFTGGVEEITERVGRGLAFHQPVAPRHEGFLGDRSNFTGDLEIDELEGVNSTTTMVVL